MSRSVPVQAYVGDMACPVACSAGGGTGEKAGMLGGICLSRALNLDCVCFCPELSYFSFFHANCYSKLISNAVHLTQ